MGLRPGDVIVGIVDAQDNARVAIKIRQPAHAPTMVPFIRIYCRSLPTTSSRRSTSVLVSQLRTTSAMKDPISVRQLMSA